MGKRARDDAGGSGRRRPRVDLSNAADASAAAEVSGAPDYEAWNRNAADPEPVDPVQAALAAKARRVQALGPLGEHLAGYGEDDDAEAVDGTGIDPATATELKPAPPWTRLVDEKTRHPYFWNRDTGATVWTLAETTVPTTAVGLNSDETTGKDVQQSNADANDVTRTHELPRDETINDGRSVDRVETASAPTEKNKNDEALEPELEPTLLALTSTAQKVLRREVYSLVARSGKKKKTETAAFLNSCVPKVQSAIERVFRAEEVFPDADADVASEKEAPPGIEPPPPLPDSPPPSPPPPPGAIAKPPALRRPARDDGESEQRPASAPSKKEKATKARRTEPLLRISRPPPSAVVERWRAVSRAARDDDDDEKSNPDKQAKRRDAEVSAWRERAARGEEPGVAGNANFAPVAGDWRTRAAAARLRRERISAAAGDGSGFREGKHGDEKEPETGSFGDRTSAAADAAAATAGVDVAAASSGLPTGWRAFYDDAVKSLYYGNADTGETRWDPPTINR